MTMSAVNVNSIRVSFTRERQPEQFVKAVPTVELSASLDDGADYEAAARSLMLVASRTVYAALGYDMPAAVSSKLGGIGTVVVSAKSDEVSEAVEPVTGDKPLSDKLIEQAAAKAEANVGDRKRGRPAKEKPAVEEASNISLTPEDRQDPANPVDDIPDDDIPDSGKPATASKPVVTSLDDIPDSGTQTVDTKAKSDESEELTAKDIQASVVKHLHNKEIVTAKVHEFLHQFGVTRISDLKPEDIGKFSIMLADEVARNKARKAA